MDEAWGTFQTAAFFLEIGEHWKEKNFHFSLQRSKQIVGEFLN
jgi:hypothetical protein